MKVVVVHNPSAGRSDMKPRRLEAVLRRCGHPAECISTESSHWSRQVEQLLPADLLLVVGGDGTLGKVARKVAMGATPFSLLPVGTANNVASHLGIAGEAADLAASWMDWELQRFDFGVAHGPWGSRRFVESAGIGVFAQMIPILSALKKGVSLPERSDEIEHDREVLARVLGDCRPRKLALSIDGEALEGKFLMVELTNISRIGPGLRVAPGARIDDGALDLLACSEEQRSQLEALMSADESDDDQRPPLRRARSLQFVWDGAPLHVDGRVYAHRATALRKPRRVALPDGEAEVCFEVLPGAAQVLAPPRGAA